jgi:hypothetical protein
MVFPSTFVYVPSPGGTGGTVTGAGGGVYAGAGGGEYAG